MKRLFVLSVVMLLTASSVGCNSCRRWWRGTFVDPCPAEEACYDPCTPMIGPATGCSSCAGPAATTVVPGPAATYVPSN
jgi:hypothetical protein